MNRDILERLKANSKPRPAHAELPTAPRRLRRPRARSFLLPFFVLLGSSVLALAAWSAVSSPALASMLSLGAAPAPTRIAEQFWARAALPKAAFVPTGTPPPAATAAPEIPAGSPSLEAAQPPLMLAEIVADTPVPEGSYTGANPGDTAPPISYTGNKYILVDISEQHLYAYQDGNLLYSFVASTGMNNATKTGTFAVQSKIPNAYGSTWDIWMPNWLGIYWAGGSENGIHALPILSNGGILWAGFLGRPISYGCVVLGTYESGLLYDWADYGTPVEIQW
jgi:lipoprotein-anchoring transpeptidase ErfK/SrfK